MPDPDLPTLTAEQTAARLGIKLETLYAYVARGRLDRTRGPDGSAFDPLEVERFAAARRSRTAPVPGSDIHGHSDGRPLMVIETDLTLIEDGRLFYRGRDATELAASDSFEQVAHWLLTGVDDPDARFRPRADAVAHARSVADAMPASATLRDRQQVAVTTLAALDPLRHSLDPATVVSAGEALVAGMVAVLPESGPAPDVGHAPDIGHAPGHLTAGRLADVLWSKLTPRPEQAAGVAALNAALVLLIDHDMAISTLAARAAASARANPYAVVTAGLGALDSLLHGNASVEVARMLGRIVAGESPERVVADTVAVRGGAVPGFGQALYPGIDPRARAILGMLAPVDGAQPVLDAAARTSRMIAARTGAHPNVDFALAALTLGTGMAPDAGEVIFATARSVGWIAHALAEYRERPLRLRPVGRYVGH
ncbi:MAG TPA: citrate synthase [Diaminobutyricibacter sp.]